MTQARIVSGQEEVSYRDFFVNSNKSYFQSVISSRAKYEEYRYDRGISISSTDLRGIIVYVNRSFCKVSGYEKHELLGKSHNIARHPEMPREIFKEMWNTIGSGKDWVGIIKNLRKDGKYYWAHSHVIPIMENGNVIGYSSLRKPVLRNELDDVIVRYNKLLLAEDLR
ncbi:MAG: PAS domain S-box protein [Campylobacterales bacterium]|nr:PAS domain S-box protein [Campylobacterales bacterium]